MTDFDQLLKDILGMKDRPDNSAEVTALAEFLFRAYNSTSHQSESKLSRQMAEKIASDIDFTLELCTLIAKTFMPGEDIQVTGFYATGRRKKPDPADMAQMLSELLKDHTDILSPVMFYAHTADKLQQMGYKDVDVDWVDGKPAVRGDSVTVLTVQTAMAMITVEKGLASRLAEVMELVPNSMNSDGYVYRK